MQCKSGTIARGVVGAPASAAPAGVGAAVVQGHVAHAVVRGVALLLVSRATGLRPVAHANLPELLVNLQTLQTQLFHLLPGHTHTHDEAQATALYSQSQSMPLFYAVQIHDVTWYQVLRCRSRFCHTS